MDDPAARKRIEDSGSVPVGGSPDAFAAEISSLYERLKKVVAERKLTIE